jgi:hypothetical protein
MPRTRQQSVIKCISCKEVVIRGESGRPEGMRCDGCELWYHPDCSKVGLEDYKAVEKIAGGTWYCEGCVGWSKNMMVVRRELSELKEEKDNFEKEVKEMKREIEELKATLRGGQVDGVSEEIRNAVTQLRMEVDELKGGDGIKKRLDEVRKEGTGKLEEVKKKMEQMRKEVVDRKEFEVVKRDVEVVRKNGARWKDVEVEARESFLEILEKEKAKEDEVRVQRRNKEEREAEMRVKEVLEREKRKFNVVVMGIPEGDDDNDKVEIRKVLGTLVKELCVEGEVMGRVGKKGDRARPIRVKLSGLGDKRRILARAKNLKSEIGFDSVYVVPDLTVVQQMEDRRLREEVRRLRSSGVTGVHISGGIVVSDE